MLCTISSPRRPAIELYIMITMVALDGPPVVFDTRAYFFLDFDPFFSYFFLVPIAVYLCIYINIEWDETTIRCSEDVALLRPSKMPPRVPRLSDNGIHMSFNKK